MNNRGLTLVELIIAMVISGIIFLALTCQFVSELTFRTMINNQIAATNEASIVMRHMTRVLRYAKPLTISTTTASGYATSIMATIDYAAAGSNLPEFTADTVVTYGRKSDNTFEYSKGGVVDVISNRITAFPATSSWWDGADLTIQITAQQGNKSSSLNTKIHVLGT
ncbi:MAG: prepilin-type N-terminal cleavage/methylation domain-containing protein [Candidatus Omnitrophica bacterium]|nr:prepilin-type N-terminal cleavage/methylation domain-containing protein [Candidatus Omnitrophota bacterium]